MSKNRPLAKALHTVTSTANVARFLRHTGVTGDAISLTRDALAVLGYSQAQIDAADREWLYEMAFDFLRARKLDGAFRDWLADTRATELNL